MATSLYYSSVLIHIRFSDDGEDRPVFDQYSNSEITRQLIKDGYNLHADADDDDLDLIPPKPIRRCVCCNMDQMCSLQ